MHSHLEMIQLNRVYAVTMQAYNQRSQHQQALQYLKIDGN